MSRNKPIPSAQGHVIWSTALALVLLCLEGCAAKGKGEVQGGLGGSTATSGAGPTLNVDTDAAAVELTCADAATSHSYAGCDFWPTVTLNPVWSIFDFAAIVANVGSQPASVTVTGSAGQVASATVAPHGLAKLYLPWVAALKGPDFDTCSNNMPTPASIFAAKSAFHLTSTQPVIVNQFNALEFRGQGGASEKLWSTCPGVQDCSDATTGSSFPLGCFSFSNDASILLPSSALTGNYRVMTLPPGSGSQGFFAITGTQDLTSVSITLSASASVLAGTPLSAGGPGDVIQVSLNAGDVVEVVGTDEKSDLSGSLVQANRPVQVIAGAACAALPSTTAAGDKTSCDHLEETVLPAETLGKHYVVALPTGALGKPVPQTVRLYGNVDGTTLTYSGTAPAGAPTQLNAGQVVDLGLEQQDFEITADHEIAVGMFLLSADVADPDDIVSRGDPSQSQAITIDQYRTDYEFLAPDDYDVNFVDIIMPLDAHVSLDNSPLPGSPAALEGTQFGVARVRLGAGDQGAHTLTSDKPVGLQVLGYGSYTSYEYPGGLDLKQIAPPPK
jgi:IgGFc binding protein